jgi:hypothetical protein
MPAEPRQEAEHPVVTSKEDFVYNLLNIMPNSSGVFNNLSITSLRTVDSKRPPTFLEMKWELLWEHTLNFPTRVHDCIPDVDSRILG